MINVEKFFKYLDDMESRLGDIHCDNTNDILTRAQARTAQSQYWYTGQILSEYLKSIGLWEDAE